MSGMVEHVTAGLNAKDFVNFFLNKTLIVTSISRKPVQDFHYFRLNMLLTCTFIIFIPFSSWTILNLNKSTSILI